MKTIRRGTFETNSSSTHSISICTISEFEQWKNGGLYYDDWNNKFITKDEYNKKMESYKEDFISDHPDFDENDEDWIDNLNDYLNEDKEYYTYDEYSGYDYLEYEKYEKKYKTPNGEEIIAFGYYGQDM